MDEDISIHRLLHRINKKTMMRFKDKLKPYDFTRGEFPFLLGLIRRGDGLTQKEICANIPISKSTTSKIVNSLVEKGYLRKETDEEDRRATRIYLTDKREEIEKTIQDIDMEAEKVMMEGFDEEEKRILRRYLKRILDNIGEGGD